MFDLNSRAKPIVKWAGGKTQLLPDLVELLPVRFNRYIEPLIGGGALFLSLPSEHPSVINDTNHDLMLLYRVVREQPEALMRELDRLAAAYSEKFYYALRADEPERPLARAARMLFLNKTGFNGLYRENAKGKFNVPFGRRKACPELYDRANLERVSARLKHAEILSVDFETAIDAAREGDLVYCDPPYLPRSATSNFAGYTLDGFGVEDHERLKRACERAAARGALAVISNSATETSYSLYRGWTVRELWARRSINSKAERRGEVKELVAIR